MARTYRNRNTIPDDWTVRDDGIPYHKGADRFGGLYDENPHRKVPRYRRRDTRCERKSERKEHYRSFRAKVKDRMAHEDWENIPRLRRTSGWLTW